MPEFLELCPACNGKEYVFKNFRNKDGSASLIPEQNCGVCKGKGVMAVNRKW